MLVDALDAVHGEGSEAVWRAILLNAALVVGGSHEHAQEIPKWLPAHSQLREDLAKQDVLAAALSSALGRDHLAVRDHESAGWVAHLQGSIRRYRSMRRCSGSWTVSQEENRAPSRPTPPTPMRIALSRDRLSLGADFFHFFRWGSRARGCRSPLATRSVFGSVGWRTDGAAPNTY